MKVLWFSLSPCGALRKFGQHKYTQTWMTTLENGLKNNSNIDLSVAYYTHSINNNKPFDYECVHYYPMMTGRMTYVEKVRKKLWGYTKNFTEENLNKMEQTIKFIKPDIIHVHGSENDFGLIVERIKNIPVVVSIQGLMSPIAEKYYAGVSAEEDRQVNKYAVKQYRDFIKHAEQERRILSNVKYVIGRTDWDKKITSLFNPSRKYYIVNEIMRDEFFKYKWKPQNNHTFKIISVLSAGIYKGYKTILKTATLLKEYGKIDFKWNVIGCTDNDIYVASSIRTTSIQPLDVNVFFQGHKSAYEIVKIMLESSLFVQTGHIENSPNALCEALVIGIPCIASNVGGTSSMLKNGIDGILFQEGDPYSLAAEIMKLYKNYENGIKMAEHVSAIARERHCSKRVIEELIFAYDAIIKDFTNKENE